MQFKALQVESPIHQRMLDISRRTGYRLQNLTAGVLRSWLDRVEKTEILDQSADIIGIKCQPQDNACQPQDNA